MAVRLNAFRITGMTTALAGAAVLALVAHEHFRVPPLPTEPPRCDPLPSNIVKLGPAIVVANPAELTNLNELNWPELRAKLRHGDVLRSFETPVTGGHLVMRGECVVGQTLAWIR